MTKAKSGSLSNDIDDLEKRMAVRRDVVARRFDDVKAGLEELGNKAARSWPALAVAGGLAAGYAISRGVSARHPVRASESVRYAPAAHTEHRSHTGGIVAALLGVAATALRIATSGEARAIYNVYKGFRGRRGT